MAAFAPLDKPPEPEEPEAESEEFVVPVGFDGSVPVILAGASTVELGN